MMVISSAIWNYALRLTIDISEVFMEVILDCVGGTLVFDGLVPLGRNSCLQKFS